ncbi:ATP-dependent Clp protease proteolytic subunit [[Actinomadura] parvosata subsp. kistnae]|nr:ATP-dependent Clp protease proteolytic subunit [Actinomadura parvosata subsp. kistnae]
MTAIYDTMQFVRPEIHTVCIGEAASAAAVLLAAGTPGKRAALPHARVLLHEPRTEGGRGQGSDLEIHAREILRMRDQQEEILARHTGRGVLEIRKDIERDRIFTAEQARAYRLIDDVYASRKRTLMPAR